MRKLKTVLVILFSLMMSLCLFACVPEEQKEEGPAELLFVHAGHTAKVNDISWNLDVGEEGRREG